MNDKNMQKISERIGKILGRIPSLELPEDEEKRFIAKLYKAGEEKKTIVRFSPFRDMKTAAVTLAAVCVTLVVYNNFLAPV